MNMSPEAQQIHDAVAQGLSPAALFSVRPELLPFLGEYLQASGMMKAPLSEGASRIALAVQSGKTLQTVITEDPQLVAFVDEYVRHEQLKLLAVAPRPESPAPEPPALQPEVITPKQVRGRRPAARPPVTATPANEPLVTAARRTGARVHTPGSAFPNPHSRITKALTRT